MRSRFYGKYRGTVTSVDTATLRLKAKRFPRCSVLSKAAGACLAFLLRLGRASALLSCPRAAPACGSSSRSGDVSYPVWVGCYWRDGEIPSDATPTVKAIVTAGKGAKILLDDDAQTITLTDSSNNKVTLSSDGITLERGSNKVVVSDSNVSVNDGALEVM